MGTAKVGGIIFVPGVTDDDPDDDDCGIDAIAEVFWVGGTRVGVADGGRIGPENGPDGGAGGT